MSVFSTSLFIAGVGVFIHAAPVAAADLSTDTGTGIVEPQLDPVQNSSIFNGAYAGLYGGLNWKSVGVMGTEDVDLSKQKEIGGYVGINQTLGSSIIGGLEWMGGFSGDSNTFGGYKATENWETSLRARMGYAFEQNLVYGLAGVSASQLELSDATRSDTEWLTGWTVGAGLERQLTERITGRVEYDYSQYGEKRFDLGTGPVDAGLSGHGVKLGIGLNF